MTALAAQLLDAVGRLPEDRFAVVDGAFLPIFRLSCAHCASRPGAFICVAAMSMICWWHPIWCVSRPTSRAGRLSTLIGDHPTGIFWSEPRGMDALFGHLRRLNVVRIAAVDEPA
ncbi:MAG: hypothetical protein HC834_07805 [Rhodospirillales bacterium]|nr:hypothetical protein [Rhodospirillales bacterium]